MLQIDPQCINIGCGSGWGYNYCCWGCVYCIPDSIRTYSGVKAMGADVVGVNNSNTGRPLNSPGYY